MSSSKNKNIFPEEIKKSDASLNENYEKPDPSQFKDSEKKEYDVNNYFNLN